ncbi:MAG TPA: Ig-like domain-containing protein, partial [Vitreimonas sp.]|nr:Ig-like domain-containing protein [Vitreimonas sp.]
MRRRVFSIGSLVVAVIALVVVLVNATLVDRRPPTVASASLSAPADVETNLAQTLTAIDVHFSEPVHTGSVERRFRIEPYVGGTITWDGSTATFTPAEKLPPDTQFTVTIERGFQDLAGNAATSGLDGFTFRTVGPPAVAGVEPAGGSDGVPVETEVTITFDRLMDTTSVEEAVRIEPPVPVTAAWSGASLTLSFEARLQFGTTYTVTVGRSAADTDGSRLRVPYVTEFSTVAAGLGIVATVPGDGGAGVSVRTPIAVILDGPIDPDSIVDALTITPAVNGNLRVTALPDDRVAPRPEGEPPGVVLLFEPSEPLAAHTTYTVQLDPVLARLGAPGQVASGRTWRFTTGQPTASAHNHIAFLASRSGTRHVWLMNPDGSAPRQLTWGLASVTAFDVTLDGSRVAFAAGGEVRTMATDGSNEAVLTTGGRFEYAPRFAPDGRSLLVARREADGSDAGWWLVPLELGAEPERQLLSSGAPPLGSTTLQGDGIEAGDGLPAWLGRAAWDPEGRRVLVTTEAGDVVILDLETDDPERVVIETGLVSVVGGAWSPAGRRFLVAGREPGATTDGIHAVEPRGTTRRLYDATGPIAAAGDGRLALLVPGPGGEGHLAVAA